MNMIKWRSLKRLNCLSVLSQPFRLNNGEHFRCGSSLLLSTSSTWSSTSAASQAKSMLFQTDRMTGEKHARHLPGCDHLLGFYNLHHHHRHHYNHYHCPHHHHHEHHCHQHHHPHHWRYAQANMIGVVRPIKINRPAWTSRPPHLKLHHYLHHYLRHIHLSLHCHLSSPSCCVEGGGCRVWSN